jgi:hypothetical protein
MAGKKNQGKERTAKKATGDMKARKNPRGGAGGVPGISLAGGGVPGLLAGGVPGSPKVQAGGVPGSPSVQAGGVPGLPRPTGF